MSPRNCCTSPSSFAGISITKSGVCSPDHILLIAAGAFFEAPDADDLGELSHRRGFVRV